MSHTLAAQSGSNLKMFSVTIVNYAVGGEQFTAAEFGASQVISVIPGQVPASANSLGVPLFPVLDSGKVKLYQFVGGSPVEIAATTNLNAVIPVLMLVA